MFQDKPEWIAHQRQRWLRPDAEHWLRPDAHRWVTPEERKRLPLERNQAVAQPHSEPVDLTVLERAREHLLRLRGELVSLRADLKFRRFFRSLKAGFRYDQSRWPRGSGRNSGRWSRGVGALPSGNGNNSAPTRGGHHFVPKEIFNDPALRLPQDAWRVFEQAVTGPLSAGPHRWSKEHDTHNDAVKEYFNRFIKENGIQTDKMTPEQAQRFLDAVKRSTDPRIRGLNISIYRREIFFQIRRIGRGSE